MRDVHITDGDKTLTRVIIEQWDRRYITESPYCDTQTPEELLRLVTAALVASSWSEEQIATAFHQFANDLVSEQWLPEDPAPATEELNRWCTKEDISGKFKIVLAEDVDEDFLPHNAIPEVDSGHSEGQNSPAGEAVTEEDVKSRIDPDDPTASPDSPFVCPYKHCQYYKPNCTHDYIDEDGNHHCNKSFAAEDPDILDELANHKINPHRFADPDYNKLIEEKEMQESHEAADPIFVSSSTSPVNLSEYCDNLKKQKIEG